MSFENYMRNWWSEYISDHRDNASCMEKIFEQMGFNKSEYLEDGDSVADFLETADVDMVYKFFFGYDGKADSIDDIPGFEEFSKSMIMAALSDIGYSHYSFADGFAEDMAYHIGSYSCPDEFFDDLQNGCQSGLIGMLIYNADCKRIYIEHIDDMEDFKSELEDGIGDVIRNKQSIPHYTFMCWLCYEELGYAVARELFPESF